MSGFIIESFGGIAPKLDPRRVAESVAQIATNCILSAGALESLPGMVGTADSVSATAKSIYRYTPVVWLAYTADRNFARAPIANDVRERLVITGTDTYPLIYSAGASYRLGIPAPAAVMTVVPSSVPSDPNNIDAETISYVYTYVDAWGAEGPPSPPSASVDRVRDTTVALSTMSVAPAGNYNMGAGAVKRIYRSNSGSTGANYQYVGQVGIAATTFNDTVINADLSEVLPSATWIGPPDDDTALYPTGTMIGVTALPNGILCGFAKNTLCFSEPYLYHAWPLEYRIAFDEDIVGLASVAAGLLVATTRTAYVVAGVSPAAMSVDRLEINEACVAKRGLVDMGDYAIYPSPDGLVSVAGNQATMVTEGIFTREQWQEYAPDTITAFAYEGKYIGFYNNGVAGSFIFDPAGGVNAFVNTTPWVRAGFYDPATDTLFVNDGGTIREWGQDFSDTYPYQWRSKKHMVPGLVNYGCVRVQAWWDLSIHPVTVKVWADGELISTSVINNSVNPFSRLPGGFLAKEWEVEFTGSNPISHAGLFATLSGSV